MMDQPYSLDAELEAVKRERDQFLDALQWCSASSDFQVFGLARKGWLKLCAPLIEKKPYYPEEESIETANE
ncbi:hypothetical protein LCGC14_0353760 [marine sediment metagenome]|uniref:Uncharacterized protein n=1 Tax=marine sediment metagenome TaxID=412755 RepID=A0A0F9TFT1_9ZZZZ